MAVGQLGSGAVGRLGGRAQWRRFRPRCQRRPCAPPSAEVAIKHHGVDSMAMNNPNNAHVIPFDLRGLERSVNVIKNDLKWLRNYIEVRRASGAVLPDDENANIMRGIEQAETRTNRIFEYVKMAQPVDGPLGGEEAARVPITYQEMARFDRVLGLVEDEITRLRARYDHQMHYERGPSAVPGGAQGNGKPLRGAGGGAEDFTALLTEVADGYVLIERFLMSADRIIAADIRRDERGRELATGSIAYMSGMRHQFVVHIDLQNKLRDKINKAFDIATENEELPNSAERIRGVKSAIAKLNIQSDRLESGIAMCDAMIAEFEKKEPVSTRPITPPPGDIKKLYGRGKARGYCCM